MHLGPEVEGREDPCILNYYVSQIFSDIFDRNVELHIVVLCLWSLFLKPNLYVYGVYGVYGVVPCKMDQILSVWLIFCRKTLLLIRRVNIFHAHFKFPIM